MTLREDEERRRKARREWVVAGRAVVIPFLLLAGPLVGYLLARGVQWMIDSPSGLIVAAGVMLGLLAGIVETVNLIRKMSGE
ncbi:hypothetical protein HS125_13185 [bacterium]|nr:hypothetical protein [bacterium]